MNLHKEKIQKIMDQYPVGTKVKLISMEGEPQMPEGLEGTVELVDDIGQIHVKWKNGSSLALNLGIDNFTIIK